MFDVRVRGKVKENTVKRINGKPVKSETVKAEESDNQETSRIDAHRPRGEDIEVGEAKKTLCCKLRRREGYALQPPLKHHE